MTPRGGRSRTRTPSPVTSAQSNPFPGHGLSPATAADTSADRAEYTARSVDSNCLASSRVARVEARGVDRRWARLRENARSRQRATSRSSVVPTRAAARAGEPASGYPSRPRSPRPDPAAPHRQGLARAGRRALPRTVAISDGRSEAIPPRCAPGCDPEPGVLCSDTSGWTGPLRARRLSRKAQRCSARAHQSQSGQGTRGQHQPHRQVPAD